MSREAMGENGAILGSSEYWKRLNESTIFGSLMRDTSSRAYYDTLRSAGERANDAVSEVYEDLQDNLRIIAGVSSDRRSTLAKRIDALYDVCNMGGVTCRRRDDCIGILELSSRYVPSPDREVENALQMLERDFSFTTYEAVSLLEEAVTWGFDRATWRDERKINFLLKLMQGNREDFLKTVLDAYNNRSGKVDARGKCGYELGSSEYLRHLEKQVFLQELPSRLGEDYKCLLQDSLNEIAKHVERDLETNEKENNYISDDIAAVLHDAVNALSRCGIHLPFSDEKIDQLAWYVGGNIDKILLFQRLINRTRLIAQIEEDGVYGEETAEAINRLVAAIKDDLQAFLLNEDAMAAVMEIISLDLDIRCEKMARTKTITPKEIKTNLVRILFDNRQDIQRFIWRWGAKNILRSDGCEVAAFMLERSLEEHPSDLYCGQTHWITQKIMESKQFQDAFFDLQKRVLLNPRSFLPVGEYSIDFQSPYNKDLYLGIGKCTLKYCILKRDLSFRVDFLIDDPYDFNEIRSFGVNKEGVAFFKMELGSLANDVALFSQSDRVISSYETHIRFSKTI